ncbi:MAG: ROK family protein [Rhodospirillaceae bacterium]
MLRIGIDLGGTKIEGAALGADGRVVAGRRIATPREDYDGTVRAVAGLVAAIEAETGSPGSVGVGMPGAVSPATGLVKNANSTWLIGRPLGPDLERALGRRVRLANDANCFALSEACDGAAAGADVVFGAIIGTGTGGGIAVRQQVLTGPNAIAGEWGHNPLPWPEPEELPGPACYCGRHGCIETFLSGPGLARDHERVTGVRAASEAIASSADDGDEQAQRTLRRYEHRMARALASIINVLDPDVIVLGGGLSKMARLYRNVPALWAPWVFSDRVDTRLVAPRHGDASGVRGAARLWPGRDPI